MRFVFIAWDLQQEKNPDSGATPYLQTLKSFLSNGCSRMSITDNTTVEFQYKKILSKKRKSQGTHGMLWNLFTWCYVLTSNPIYVQAICRWSASRNGVHLNCQKKLPARLFHRLDTTSGAYTLRGIGCNLSPGDAVQFLFFFSLDTTRYIFKRDQRWSASEAYRECRSSSEARSWTPARTACTGSTWGSPAHRPALKHINFLINFTKDARLRHNYGVGVFNTFFLSTEYIQSGNGRFLAHIPSWWKISPASWWWGVHAHPPFPIFTITYKVAVYTDKK